MIWILLAKLDYLKYKSGVIYGDVQRPRLCEGLELEFRPPGGNADKK